MKRIINFGLLFVLLFVTCTGCSKNAETQDLWESAVYTENTEFGTGEKTLSVTVSAEEKSVTFTVHSDKKTVGEALQEHNLIDGEKGPYGLYVKSVNGIIADYDVDQSYWAFTKAGESLQTGVDGEEFSDGDSYELSRVEN